MISTGLVSIPINDKDLLPLKIEGDPKLRHLAPVLFRHLSYFSYQSFSLPPSIAGGNRRAINERRRKDIKNWPTC